MSKKLIWYLDVQNMHKYIQNLQTNFWLTPFNCFHFQLHYLNTTIIKQFRFSIREELSVQKLLLRLLSVSLVVAAKWNAHPCERWHLSQMLLLTHLVPSEQTSFCCWWWWVHLCRCVYFVWCALLSCLAGCSRESICLAWNPSASQQRSRLHSFPHTLRHIIHLTHTLLREDSKPLKCADNKSRMENCWRTRGAGAWQPRRALFWRGANLPVRSWGQSFCF